MEVLFAGAAQNVTGSKHLIITKKGRKILLDCGLFQGGKGSDNDTRNRLFRFDPTTIDAVILSHAHIDHSGNLPNLVKQGFVGPIYCTPATQQLCSIMLADSAHIQEHDINYLNKKRAKQNLEPLKPLYTSNDAEKCMHHFQKIPYNNWFTVNDELKFMFSDAGHILGSAAINIIIKEEGVETKLCFTGDIGRAHDLLLKPPAPFPQADHIICESTYGSRLHESTKDAENKLLNIVIETCVNKKGKLLIPAFSLGRTQEIVYALDRLQSSKQLPPIKVYVDSPLATNATGIMRENSDHFNPAVLEYMKTDPDPFGFPSLTYIQDVMASMELNHSNEPCIIIAASGMMEAGRIKHHIKHSISDSKNTLLIVGYCPPDSLGGKFLRGAKQVKIFGIEYDVKMKIEVINTYSAHADYKEMINYLSCQDKTKVKNIFLVHGELESILPFKTHLQEAGFGNIIIPKEGDKIELK